MTTNETQIGEQTISWIDAEIADLEKTQPTIDRKPVLKFEENKITEFEVDFTAPFQKYEATDGKGGKIIKAIIPVKQGTEAKTFWLNLKNPLYKDIMRAGKNGQKLFKVMQTGNGLNTKYILVK